MEMLLDHVFFLRVASCWQCCVLEQRSCRVLSTLYGDDHGTIFVLKEHLKTLSPFLSPLSKGIIQGAASISSVSSSLKEVEQPQHNILTESSEVNRSSNVTHCFLGVWWRSLFRTKVYPFQTCLTLWWGNTKRTTSVSQG